MSAAKGEYGVKSRIKKVIVAFPIVMTCASLAAAAYISLFWETDNSSGAELIGQLALCSLLCSFSALLFGDEGGRAERRRGAVLRALLCFFYVNAVVMLCGFAFEWFRAESWAMLAGMELTILAVYAAVCGVFYSRARRDAALVNEKLRSRDG